MSDVKDDDKVTILLRDVPGDVARELQRRAEVNFRSRANEIQAILAVVCRGHIELPGSVADAPVEAADGLVPDAEAAAAPDPEGGDAV